MKFTLSWLKEHLDTTASLAEIVDKLTMIGLEVENVEDKAALLKPFVIADVISAEKHPNADRLRVCMVDIGQVAKGEKPIQVVCGAPNAHTGMKGVFSPAGTYIPGKNMTLSVGTIRGVESHGMLCSEAELLISEDHDGIIELPADAPVGKSYAEWAGLGDPVIEINLTPNRPDCTGVNGIARDLGATLIGDYMENAPKRVAGTFPCPVKVTIDAPELCPAFGLRLVRGVKNGPSPDWLQKRLTAIGLRPINALVDITNFITYDRGRPLHVFDAGKVKGNLTVRRAENGEQLLALDGRTYTLDQGVCVIADEKGVESLVRHHGRRGIRLRREHHRRADRIGAVGRIQHRADRPQARHQFRRALSLRARRRSEFHGARPGAGDADGARPLRRRAVRDRGRRQSGAEGKDHRLPAQRIAAARRPQAVARRRAPRAGEARLLRRRPGRAGEGRGAVVAAGRARPRRHRRRDRAHRRRRPGAVDAVPARRPCAQAGADADPGAHPQGQAHAGRARADRSGDLVVHLQARGRTVRRRRA